MKRNDGARYFCSIVRAKMSGGFLSLMEATILRANRIIDQEPTPTPEGVPPAYWPVSGHLEVDKVSARYSADGPEVLHEVTFEVASGERVGIVGRTGSGNVACDITSIYQHSTKLIHNVSTLSSLTLALLRCILTEGTVRYDGIETGKINLDPLRSGPLYRNPRMGNLVMRTSDGIEFHVYRAIVSAASPLFLDMFTLPQPPSPPAPAGKPSVEVAEDSSIWSTLIALCYAPRPPVPNEFADLDAARALLDAGAKYELAVTVDFAHMGLLLRKVVEEQPFSVYALGCTYKHPDVARAAARQTLRFPVYFEHTQELDLMSLLAYHCLSEYRRKCGVYSREVVPQSLSDNFVYIPGVKFDMVSARVR
ncbi:hypothetical protein OH77DRAFT_1312846 [Trametes cingulata]|nr:hypothetical protein OH77DRAFT_1312846 [Trametes cingulata]